MSIRIKSRPGKSRQRGFSLAELMVTTAIASLFFTVLSALIFFCAKSFVAMANYADLEKSSRNALDILSREVRQSTALVEWDQHKIVLDYTNNMQLKFAYNPEEQTLKREFDGKESTLLKGCTNLTFAIYQRNPVNGTYDQYPVATSLATCKLIQVNWKCVRSIFDAKINTESVQSAKIVIRRQ